MAIATRSTDASATPPADPAAPPVAPTTPETPAAPEGDPKPDDAPVAEGEAAPAPAAYDPTVVTGAVTGSFTHKEGPWDYRTCGVTVCDTPQDVAKLADGTAFFAAFLYDPAKSEHHYDIASRIVDLINGRISRHGISIHFWRDFSNSRPPVARRDENSATGYVLMG